MADYDNYDSRSNKGGDGIPYMRSSEGIVRVCIIVVACITFSLIAHSGFGGVITWIMAAYIISFIISLQSYFLLATNVASKMNCGFSYYTVDVSLSIFCFFQSLLASLVLAMYTNSLSPNERIAAVVLGFVLTVLYAIEIYLLYDDAPESFYYLRSAKGILKILICVLGCVAFALLGASGFHCYLETDGCDPARTWAFAAFIYSWAGSVILLLLNVIGLSRKTSLLERIDFFWSIFAGLNFFIAAIVVACYIKCIYFDNYECGTRLGSVIFGFITTVLYAIEAVLLNQSSDFLKSKNKVTTGT